MLFHQKCYIYIINNMKGHKMDTNTQAIILTNVSIPDLFGYASIVFTLFAFYSIKRKNMLWLGLISTLLFGISIYFYGGINGFFVSIFSVFLKIAGLYGNEKIAKKMKIISILIAFGFFAVFSNEGLVGILPAASLIFISMADMQRDIIKMKYIYFGSVFCWLTYGIVLGSLPAILFDIVGAIALISGIGKSKKEANSVQILRPAANA